MAKRFLIVPPNYEIQLGISKVVEYTREQAVELIQRNTERMTWKEAQGMSDERINALIAEAHEKQTARDKQAAAARYQLVAV